MAEREESNSLIERLTERVDQILNKVSNIDAKLDKHTDQLNQVDIKIALLEQKDKSQEAEINSIKTENNKMKWQIIGGGMAILTGVIVALIKSFIGF